jgi:hypothetical protein
LIPVESLTTGTDARLSGTRRRQEIESVRQMFLVPCTCKSLRVAGLQAKSHGIAHPVRCRFPLSFQSPAACLCPRFVRYQGLQCYLFPENNPTPAFLSNEVRKKQTRIRAEVMVNRIRKIGQAIFAAIFFFLEFPKSFPAEAICAWARCMMAGNLRCTIGVCKIPI